MPIHIAAREGSLEIVQFYVQKCIKGEIDTIDMPMVDGWTPFLYAAVNGYPSIVDLLGAPLVLDNSRRKTDQVILSNVNVTDRFKRNALHWLIRQMYMGFQRDR